MGDEAPQEVGKKIYRVHGAGNAEQGGAQRRPTIRSSRKGYLRMNHEGGGGEKKNTSPADSDIHMKKKVHQGGENKKGGERFKRGVLASGPKKKRAVEESEMAGQLGKKCVSCMQRGRGKKKDKVAAERT